MQYDDRDLRKLQLLELRILKEVDRVCRELGITYFLDSGSVLGALRHGGFIPWDDDIDLGMPRADYDRFVAETIEAGFDQGIFVDLLPYDALSSDPATAAKQRRDCRFWQSVSYLSHAKSIVVPHKGALGAIERAACGAAHLAARGLYSPEKIVSRFNKAATCGNDPSLASDDLVVMAYATYEPYARSMMLPTSTVTFEGFEFPAPADPEAFLRQLYGEWQKLPPVEARRNHAPVELDFGPYA